MLMTYPAVLFTAFHLTRPTRPRRVPCRLWPTRR